jgi:hypothetical protein
LDPKGEEAMEKENLEELRAKHGRVEHIEAEDGAWEVVIRAPTRQQYTAFKHALQDEVQKPRAVEMLFRAICVHPSEPAELDKLLDDFPAIPEACSDEIMALLGAKAKKRAKG